MDKPSPKEQVALYVDLCAAVGYALCQIQSNPDLNYVAGPGTELFRKLCAAEARATGKDPRDVERERGALKFRGRVRTLRTETQWRQIRVLEDAAASGADGAFR